mgnify:CR=1 FL=1
MYTVCTTIKKLRELRILMFLNFLMTVILNHLPQVNTGICENET